MHVTLSVLGMLNADPSVLDGLQQNIPTGVSFDDLQDNIIQECAELEITIPRPDTFKYLLSSWARRKKLSWQRYYTAITTEYNPLENYDRQEDFTDTGSGTDSTSQNMSTSGSSRTAGTNSERNAGTDTESITEENTASETTAKNTRDGGTDVETKSGTTVLDRNVTEDRDTITDQDQTTTENATRTPNITIEEKVAAFNSSTYEPKTQRKETGTETTGNTGSSTNDISVDDTNTIEEDTTTTIQESGQKTHDYSITESDSSDTESEKTITRQLDQDHTLTGSDDHTTTQTGTENQSISSTNSTTNRHAGRVHGNIGVTTSQQMLISELDLVGRLDIYQYITQDFKQQFCVLIY